MKITQQPPEPPPFKPVTIILETQDEVDQLTGILDTTSCKVTSISTELMASLRKIATDASVAKYYKALNDNRYKP